MSERGEFMFKKIIALTVVSIMMLMLCSCESKEVKEAKAAYADGDYAKAVDLLSQEGELDEETQRVYVISQAHVAYDNKEYDQVVELLEKETNLKDEDLINMRDISDANLKYENGKNLDALKSISSIDKYEELEVYQNAISAIVKEALKSGKTKNLKEAINICPKASGFVIEKVTEACDKLDYKGFVVLQKLVNKSENKEITEALQEYYDKNKLNKPKSYLIGKWKETDEQGQNRVIEVTLSDNDMVGIIDSVQEGSSYKKNDLYWTDFKFIDEKRCTLISISRGDAGDTNESNAVGNIDYKNGTLQLHLTPSSGLSLTYYDTNWKRMED